MPELPEVEIMAQKLHGWTADKTIWKAEVSRNPGGRYDVQDAVGGTFLGVFRRGKQLFFKLNAVRHVYHPFYVVCHNAMSGYWDLENEPWTFDYVEGTRTATERDVRIRFELSDGSVLRFHDARLFGNVKVVGETKMQEILRSLGPEAITTPRMFPGAPHLNVLDVGIMFGLDKRPVKELLLDQRLVAGVGNIYASECLWRASVSPHRPGHGLDNNELQAITESIVATLRGALERNLDYSGLKVYRRKVCPRCSGEIRVDKIAGRSTYWCEKCQR